MTNNFLRMYLLFILIFSFIFSSIDLNTNKVYKKAFKTISKKDKLLTIFILYFHHVIYFFFFLTIFFIIYDYKNVSIYFLAVYLISLTVLLLHWITNNNKCIITEYHNRLIKIDENIGFRDFIQILSNKYPTSGEPLNELTVRNKIIYGYIMTIGVIIGMLIYFK